mmetsp:Transcript_21870/g.30733  ORF Transcript_21870/g.30733 Transcript_21870/m.30733 type:complete len:346 (-) Transcript_21870:171-1208(-)
MSIINNAYDKLLTINIYPDTIHTEAKDLSQDFGIEIDDICKDIYEACKGWGTSNKRLIKTMTSLDSEKRHKVSLRYKEMYEKDLKELMKKEVGNSHYGQALKYLSLSPASADCSMIRKACDGLGTNELVLYPIICGRSNKDMDLLKLTFYKMYTKDLGSYVRSELSGNISKLATSCLQGAEAEFDNDYHTIEQAIEDAKEFYKAGQGRWFTTDGKNLFKLLAESPPKYLKMINDAYADKYGYTLFKALEKNLGGIAEDAALFTIGMKLKPYETVAKLIKKACAGLGTNELLLTCCLIRYFDILPQVNTAHIELFNKSIRDRVNHETSGNYNRVLVGILDQVVPEA